MNIITQAVHQHFNRRNFEQALILVLLDATGRERSIYKRCVLEKLNYLIQPDWIGRDRFCILLVELDNGKGGGKNHRRTIYTVSSRYQNLIEGKVVSRP